MDRLKTLALAAICSFATAPAFADAALVDVKEKLYDADVEVVAADYGYVIGTAAYGANDADYDVYLTAAEVFPPLLGHYDADYEAVLKPASHFQTATIYPAGSTEIASR